MFELNSITLPLDVDNLDVLDRIDKASRKMRQAVKTASQKPQIERGIVAALKVWCNEVFADKEAGNLLLNSNSLNENLKSASDIATKIGTMRSANTMEASANMATQLKGALISAGMTEEDVEALATANE